jgi:L-alanine-DL-glutamate epimerase-like enolase superfamily enzyme
MSNNNFCISNFSAKTLRKKLLYPFRTALGEHKNLTNLLFTLTLKGGLKGYGEAAIATHITGETVEATAKNLEIQGQELIGANINDYLAISRKLHVELSQNKSAICAIEMAMLDALTKKLNVPLWKIFGGRCKKLTTDITIVIADLNQTEKSIKSFYEQGFRAFKVKIGSDFDLDLKRAILIKKIAKRSKIYLDANQAYSAKETLLFLKLLKKAGIRPDLIEQPVKKGDWEGLKQITQGSDVSVCADESVRSVDDCRFAIKKKAVSAVNIKLMKSGLIEGREIATLAHQAGLDLMIGGMMESSLAMTAAAHFAAGLGFFKYIDLDTPFFLKEGKGNPYLSPAGVYDLSKVKAGIGIDIR